MKIEKLITLSQFVDKYCTQWANVRNYNNFLKQPLTKDMFVNPIDEPFVLPGVENKYKADGEKYNFRFNKWKEAEKKVIFEDIDRIGCGIHAGKFRVGIIYSESRFITDFKTLYDLAEYTNGELTLKNVNI